MGCRRTANRGRLAAAVWHGGCRAADVKQGVLPQRSTGGLAILHPACNLQGVLPARSVVQMLQDATSAGQMHRLYCNGRGCSTTVVRPGLSAPTGEDWTRSSGMKLL